MCRNIKPLFNYDPPATDEEIRNAALQFVRKVSGFHTPSQANEVVFEKAIENVSKAVRELVDSLATSAPTHNREEEAAKAHERAIKRFHLAE